MPQETFLIGADADDGYAGREGTGAEWPPTGALGSNTVGTDFLARKVRHVGFNLTEISLGLFKFDTSSLPDTAVIHRAVLRISPVSNSLAESRTLDFEYYAVGTIDTGDYVESVTASAASVPAATWQAWSTASGTVDVELSNLTSISTTGSTGFRVGLGGGAPPGGSTNDTFLGIALREHATRAEPVLIVEYPAIQITPDYSRFPKAILRRI
jgi:hypothetical protein